MPRNLNNRIELFFPIEYDVHKKRILGILELLLSDNQKSHEMKADGSYKQRKASGKVKICAQNELLRMARESASAAILPSWQTVPIIRPIE